MLERLGSDGRWQSLGEIGFPAGRTLIEEGRPGREFFVIAEGTVEVRRGGRKLPQRGDSSSYGEMALLTAGVGSRLKLSRRSGM